MSNDVVIGKIEKVVGRETQWGIMYDVHINGDRFGAGKVKPKFAEGDVVKFRFTRNGNFKNVVAASMEKHDGDLPTAATPVVQALEGPSIANSPNPPTTNNPKTYEDKEKARQLSILCQGSRKDAIETAPLLLQADAVGFKSTSKWAEKHDILTAKITDLTREYYHQAVNHKDFIAGSALPEIVKIHTGAEE